MTSIIMIFKFRQVDVNYTYFNKQTKVLVFSYDVKKISHDWDTNRGKRHLIPRNVYNVRLVNS